MLEIDFAFENEKFSCIGREGLLRKVGTEIILISLVQRLMSILFIMAGRGANYRPKRVDNHLWVSLMVKMDIRIWTCKINPLKLVLVDNGNLKRLILTSQINHFFLSIQI